MKENMAMDSDVYFPRANILSRTSSNLLDLHPKVADVFARIPESWDTEIF
jgi:hypothetical protein